MSECRFHNHKVRIGFSLDQIFNCAVPITISRTRPGGFEIPIGFLAAIKDEELVRMKWRLYDELIKKKLLAKIGVQPTSIRSDQARNDTGSLQSSSLRVEEV